MQLMLVLLSALSFVILNSGESEESQAKKQDPSRRSGRQTKSFCVQCGTLPKGPDSPKNAFLELNEQEILKRGRQDLASLSARKSGKRIRKVPSEMHQGRRREAR